MRLIPCPAMPAKCFVLVVEGKWVIKKGFEERERERERELMVKWERKIKLHHFCSVKY